MLNLLNYLALMHCGGEFSLWDRDRVYADHFLEVDFLVILVPHKLFYQFHSVTE